MTFEEFVSIYDKPGTYVLPEGKRKMRESDVKYLKRLGILLAIQTQHILFRSGNAEGTDELFAEGVATVDPARMELMLPYTGHRKKQAKQMKAYAMDVYDLQQMEELIALTQMHAKLRYLVQDYMDGKKNAQTMKGAYILRDTAKVIGVGYMPPASFTLFYDDKADPMKGGTGHAMQVCNKKNVPWLDQSVRMQWLKELPEAL